MFSFFEENVVAANHTIKALHRNRNQQSRTFTNILLCRCPYWSIENFVLHTLKLFICSKFQFFASFQLYDVIKRFSANFSSQIRIEPKRYRNSSKGLKCSESGCPTIWTIDRNCHVTRSVLLYFFTTKTMLFCIESSRVMKSDSTTTDVQVSGWTPMSHPGTSQMR